MLRQISLEEITEKHLILLARMTKDAYFGMTVKQIVENSAQGLQQIWSFESGIIVTEILKHQNGTELYVCGFSGKMNFKRAFAELRVFAKRFNARWIGGEVASPRMEKIFSRLGQKHLSTRMAMEV